MQENEGIKWLTEAAEENDLEAQKRLAEEYVIGKHVNQDFEKARYWMEKAASTNDVESIYGLALILHHVDNPHRDIDKAAIYLEKAAEMGSVDAETSLGIHYYEIPDNKKALYWLKRATNHGDAEAELYLAHMYNQGRGVSKDIEKSKKLIASSAKKGNEEAKELLKQISASSTGCLIPIISMILTILGLVAIL